MSDLKVPSLWRIERCTRHEDYFAGCSLCEEEVLTCKTENAYRAGFAAALAALTNERAVCHRSQHETVGVDRATGERSTAGAAGNPSVAIRLARQVAVLCKALALYQERSPEVNRLPSTLMQLVTDLQKELPCENLKSEESARSAASDPEPSPGSGQHYDSSGTSQKKDMPTSIASSDSKEHTNSLAGRRHTDEVRPRGLAGIIAGLKEAEEMDCIPRCQARNSETGQCELRQGHTYPRHLAGYLMWEGDESKGLEINYARPALTNKRDAPAIEAQPSTRVGGTIGLDGDTRRCCNTPGCDYDYQHTGPCEGPGGPAPAGDGASK